MRIEYHRTLIADRGRNEAFHQALSQVIVPGETVVADIGAGTGLLGVMASKLGARDVYLYEAGEVASVAQEVVRANGVEGCHVIPCHSTEMLDPPQVDVVVSETFGNYAFEENMIATLNDARHRYLKPGGVIIPGQVTQHVAAVIAPRIDRELRVWDDVGFGIDLSTGTRMSLNNVYVRTLDARELLDPAGVAWDCVDFSQEQDSNRRGEAEWQIREDCRVYGLCVWWSAILAGDVAISTGPQSRESHWEQLYFPSVAPLDLAAGDRLGAMISSRSSEDEGTHLAWSLSQLARNGQRVAHHAMDLDQGFLP